MRDEDFIWEDDPVEEEKPVEEENPDFINIPTECEICNNNFKSKNPDLEFAAYQYDKKWICEKCKEEKYQGQEPTRKCEDKKGKIQPIETYAGKVCPICKKPAMAFFSNADGDVTACTNCIDERIEERKKMN